MATDDADAGGKSTASKRILGWLAAITAVLAAITALVENSDHLIKAVESVISNSRKQEDHKPQPQSGTPAAPATDKQTDTPAPIPNANVKPSRREPEEAAADKMNSEQGGLRTILGLWVVTAGAGVGEPFVFSSTLGGLEGSIPYIGQVAVLPSTGEAGSNIKIAGPGLTCYYYVSFLNHDSMTWALRSGTSPNCPPSSSFSRSH